MKLNFRISSFSKRQSTRRKVVDILKVIDVKITSNEIEAWHRLGKKKKNIFLGLLKENIV